MKTAVRSPRRSRSRSGRTSSCSRLAATSRRRARRGSLKHMGDRTSLDLIGRQKELVDAMLSRLASRSSALLFNGRPLSIRRV